MKVRFHTFEQIHNKKGVGSTTLRVHNLIKHWPEAALYKYGEKPDVMIFQKVYELPDYHFIKHLDCIKILDICDADWLDFSARNEIWIKETIDAVDAVVTSSEGLAEPIRQMTDKPVIHIADRFDIDKIPLPQKIYKPATNLVWFGYSHNAETMELAIYSLEDKYKLDQEGQSLVSEISPYKITVYSESDPMIWRNASNPEAFKEKCTYKRYHQDTILEELNKFDAAILPKGNRPKDKFKSNNRTILANLAGLPVVTTMEELKELEDHKVRNQKAIDGQQIAIKEYNVKQSVREMQELINDIKSKKSNN